MIKKESITQLVQKPFYLLRHGETEWNVQGKRQGWIDIPLNENGRKQAASLQSICATLPVSHIYYSPLSRVSETMNIACQGLQCPRITHDDFKEWHLGEWQGRGIPWFEENLIVKAPVGGESREQFSQRVLRAANKALIETQIPLFVAHSGTFRALCYHAEIIAERSIDNCQLVLFIPPDVDNDCWRYKLIASPG